MSQVEQEAKLRAEQDRLRAQGVGMGYMGIGEKEKPLMLAVAGALNRAGMARIEIEELLYETAMGAVTGVKIIDREHCSLDDFWLVKRYVSKLLPDRDRPYPEVFIQAAVMQAVNEHAWGNLARQRDQETRRRIEAQRDLFERDIY